MRNRLVRGGALVGAAATAAMVASVVPAAATSDGAHVTDDYGAPHAYAASADGVLLGQELKGGPVSEVHLAPGQKSAGDSAISFPSGNSLITGEVLGAHVTKTKSTADVAHLKILPNAGGGDLGFNQLSSNKKSKLVHGLTDNLSNLLSGAKLQSSTEQGSTSEALISLKVVKTKCTFTDGKAQTSGKILDLQILGQDINIIPTGENQTVEVQNPLGSGDLLKLTLNETKTYQSGSKYAGQTFINGVHLQLNTGSNLSNLASADLVVSHSHCGPAENNGGGNNGGGNNGGGPTTAPPTNGGAGGNGGGNGSTTANAGNAHQVTKTPAGSVDTGGGATAGVEQPWLFGLGGAMILAGGGAAAVAYRKRLAGHR
jgi:hypothetical protein